MKILYTLKRSPVLVAIALLLAVMWFFSGGAKKSKSTRETPKPFHVLVNPSTAVLKEQFLQATGRTKVSHTIDLQVRTKGVLEKRLVKEGDTVKKGAVLIKIREEDRREKVVSAKANLAEKTTRYEISSKLSKNKYRSALEVASDLANMEKARAALKMAQADLAYTELKAPFDGVIKKIFADRGEVLPLDKRQPALQMVTLDPLKVSFHVNERHHANLHRGQTALLSWENREDQQATIQYISPEADQNTHTFEVKAALPNPDHKIPAGLTTVVRIPLKQELAHRVEPASLLLSDAGLHGVRVVDSQKRVRFYPVTILASDPKHLWVTGLPEEAHIITVGQGFVREGDLVETSIQKEG